jgi:hypothetical protein
MVKHLLNATDYAAHPEDDRLSGIDSTIFVRASCSGELFSSA